MACRTKMLNQLLKVIKKQIDEKQAEVANLKYKIEQYNTTLKRMEEELQNERQASTALPTLLYAFTAFYQDFCQKREIIKNEIAKLEKELHKSLELVKEFFIEQKRYEHLLHKILSLQKAQAEKLEVSILDEIGKQGLKRAKDLLLGGS